MFATQMVKFINWIIKNSVVVQLVDLPNYLCEVPLALLNENNATFVQNLKDNNNAIA